VGLLEQDVVFDDPSRTPRQLFAAVASGLPTGAVSTPQELGLLSVRDVDRPVGALSVGQRRRLSLALLIATPPEVLLLDEPTNHISLRLAEELCAALLSAPGAILLASHDRWLRRRWHGDRAEMRSGTLVPA
jgi:macrolide transport system ATP-binding/permease protein